MRRRIAYLPLVLLLVLTACFQTTPPQPSETGEADDLSATAFGGTGLSGVYFNNMDFTGTTATRIDLSVNRTITTASPITGIAGSTYSIRWTGQVVPAFSEEYTFFLTHTDGARLMVNGQQIVSNWKDQAQTVDSGKVLLRAGVKYDIRLEFYRNATNTGSLKLEWQSTRRARQVIPKDNLFPEPTVTIDQTKIDEIQIKPDGIVLRPGEIRLVRARFLDANNVDLGPATEALTNLKLLGAGYQVKWAGNGYLHVIVPAANQSTLTYSLKLKTKETIFDTATAAVTTVKAGVVVIPENNVIFPRTDYNFPTQADANALATEVFDSFTDTEVTQASTQAGDTSPTLPVILREAGLPAFTNNIFVSSIGASEFFGQVKSVVARRNGKVLVAVKFVNPTLIYDALQSPNLSYQQLVDNGLVPQTLKETLEIRTPSTTGQIQSQAVGYECSAALMQINASFTPNFAISSGTINASVDGELTFSSNSPSATCSVFYKRDIPLSFPWGVFLDPEFRLLGEVTASIVNDDGANSPSIGLTLKFNQPILPTPSMPTGGIDRTKKFINLPSFGNLLDVTGDKVYYRGKAEIRVGPEVELRTFGDSQDFVKELLDVIDVAPGLKQKIEKVTNALNIISVGVGIYYKPTITAQWASMRSALEDASSKIYIKHDIEMSGRTAAGELLDFLKPLGINPEILVSKTWTVEPAKEYLPGSLTASVTSNDRQGNANISITNTGSTTLGKVQLGYIPANSLHGKTLGVTGGPVTYDVNECLNLGGSVTAKVVAAAELPLLGLAPFNPQQTVKLLCVPSNYELITMAGRVMEISNPFLPQSDWGWNLEAYTWGYTWTDKIPWSSAKDAAILQGRQLVVQKLEELNCILARNSEFPLYGIGNRAFDDYWYGWYTDQRIGAYCPR